jgi:ABC-type glycerol-3-phosphate transport system permease component
MLTARGRFFVRTGNGFPPPPAMPIPNDNQTDDQTVSAALGVLRGRRPMDATTTNAAALPGALPAVVLILVLRRTLTRGGAAGAVGQGVRA